MEEKIKFYRHGLNGDCFTKSFTLPNCQEAYLINRHDKEIDICWIIHNRLPDRQYTRSKYKERVEHPDPSSFSINESYNNYDYLCITIKAKDITDEDSEEIEDMFYVAMEKKDKEET